MMGVILKNSTNMEEGINLSNDIREAFLAEDLLGLLFFFFISVGTTLQTIGYQKDEAWGQGTT